MTAATLRRELQALFTTSVRGLAKQGFERAFNNRDESCVYFDEATEHRCAVGQLVSKETALNLPEGPVGASDYDAVYSALSIELQILDGRADEFGPFLKALQHAHDQASTSAEMRRELKAVARRFALRLPAVLR